MTETATVSDFVAPQDRRYVLFAAILASSMGFIDGSVISIAIPAIRNDLGATLADAQWISNGYLLFLSSLILLGGAAGDRFGLRTTFGLGIVVFVAASMVCALAPTPLVLVIARAVQGIGAAFMVPGSLAIIAKAYPREERGRAIGIWAAASSLTTHWRADHRRLYSHHHGRMELAAGVCHQPASGGRGAAAALVQGQAGPARGRTAARRGRRGAGDRRIDADRLWADRRRQRKRAAALPYRALCRLRPGSRRRLPLLGSPHQVAHAAAAPLRHAGFFGRQCADLRALFRAGRRDVFPADDHDRRLGRHARPRSPWRCCRWAYC